MIDQLITIGRRAAKLVGEIYQEHLASSIAVEMKGPNDPVTRADRDASDLIVAALTTQFPDVAVVCEEVAPSQEDLLRMSMGDRVIFVDPLDGTREFVDKTDEFCVMIGVAEDGGACGGVVAIPSDGRVLAGWKDQGAFVEDADGKRTPLKVTQRNTFDDAAMMVSRSHRPALVDPLCRRIGVSKMIPCGSAGVKISRLIDGTADLYVHAGPGLKRWDTCAPDAILAAAGGRLSDLDGHPIDYTDKDLGLRRGLVATNGVLHPGVLSAVNWAEREVDRLK